MAAVAGRAVHPINVRVGGFYSAPAPRDLLALQPELERGRDEALAALRWAARLPFPEFERDYRCVALRHDTEYPMNPSRYAAPAALLALMLAAAPALAFERVRPVTDAATKKECGECHMGFQPALLPAGSWNKIMDGQADHFGEDASLQADLAARIRAYPAVTRGSVVRT